MHTRFQSLFHSIKISRFSNLNRLISNSFHLSRPPKRCLLRSSFKMNTFANRGVIVLRCGADLLVGIYQPCVTAVRGHGLLTCIQQIKSDFRSIEKEPYLMCCIMDFLLGETRSWDCFGCTL
ncbi:hypothetical protein L1987_55427 [Smallanthus sonchifolius]|uniref:Uncharacterized protein n=1 Tax=Smallanthus sonchifolius TaxID=185202 RepID=A0ACB9EAL5_9ASTR|nr:hypothetical protein L1987_55427 [Smallanthus sonchifolius]